MATRSRNTTWPYGSWKTQLISTSFSDAIAVVADLAVDLHHLLLEVALVGLHLNFAQGETLQIDPGFRRQHRTFGGLMATLIIEPPERAAA